MSKGRVIKGAQQQRARIQRRVNNFARKLVHKLFMSYNSVTQKVTIEGPRDISKDCPDELTGEVLKRGQQILITEPRVWTFWLSVFHEVNGVATAYTKCIYTDKLTSVELDVLIKSTIEAVGTDLVDTEDNINLCHFGWVCFPAIVEAEDVLASEDHWLDIMSKDYDMFDGKATRFNNVVEHTT